MKTWNLMAGMFAILVLCGHALGQSGWTDDGTVVRLTTSTDSVGIGTDSPASILDAYGTIRITRHNNPDQFLQINPYGYIYFDAAANMDIIFRINSSEKMRILPDGNVGIGTSSPSGPLHIKGIYEDSQAHTLILERYDRSEIAEIFTLGAFYFKSDESFIFRNYSEENFFIIHHTTGNVGIGTSNPQSKLAVNGTITAKEVEVTLTGWPDHVFADNYRLMPLDEVETYIKEHNHLPDMPSAAEVEENGVSLGEMQGRLLQKVEELTLYVIDLKKENEALKGRVRELEQ